MTTLIILDEEMDIIMIIFKSFEEYGLLIKGVSKTTKNEANQQKVRFIGILLGTLGAILLGNLLTIKGVKQSQRLARVVKASNCTRGNIPVRGLAKAGEGVMRAVKGAIRAKQDFWCHLIL